MSPSSVPGTPAEWLDRANGKLVLARQPLPVDGYREDLCYMAQQAGGLAIKAVYQHWGWHFAFVHDLGQLLDGLGDNGLSIPADVQEADQLSVYATQTRYPGMADPVDDASYREALSIAEAVVAWAATIIH